MRNHLSDFRSSTPRSGLLASALAAAIVLLPGMAQAQQANVIQRSFINLGFELPSLGTQACRLYIGEAFVPGWTTTHRMQAQENSSCANFSIPGFSVGTQARILEIWRGPRNNNTGNVAVRARAGDQFAELNAAEASRISQNVCLEQGDVVRWKFSHRGRNKLDTMRFLLGNTLIAEVATDNVGSGSVLQRGFGGTATSVNSGSQNWFDYNGQFTYNGTAGVTNIGFEAVGGTVEGNFLDDIQVFLKPVIELTGGTYTTLEGTANGLPSLTVVGFIESDLFVEVTAVPGAGSPVLGSDFTTPNGSGTFTIRIPARATPYEGEQISLELAAPANTEFDGTRSVALQLVPKDEYFTRSTTNCGAAGFASARWDILDDDADLSIAKTASTTSARTGDDVTYTLTARSNPDALINVTGAVIRDPQVTGLDCSAAAPTCTATRPALCAADHSIATLQGSGMVLPEFLPGEQVQLQLVCRVTADGVTP